jgi:hypothetical protein
MDPKLIILFVLAVVVAIGAGIFFQDRHRPPGGEDSGLLTQWKIGGPAAARCA